MAANSIQVTVRVRPFNAKELPFVTSIRDQPSWIGDGSLSAMPQPQFSNKGIRRVVQVVDDRVLVFDPPEENPVTQYSKTIVAGGRKTKDMRYAFDRIFDENCSQEDVFTHTAKPLLDSVLDGFNATVFAYGATGCGKTHTISGQPDNPGLIYLTTQELFERCAALTDKKVDIKLSFLEIYNETIRDLLVPIEESKPLLLREDAQHRISVPGLTTATPITVDEVMNLILQGNENRTSSPTEANATSSRSHAVLQINVTIKNKTGGLSEEALNATLSIIDLAGSERASVTKNRGARLFEGANINKSLLALGNCINALCDANRRGHIPYRDSKLTRLLKFSLGGNCKTVMIVCISPSSLHYDETHNTLKYGNRAKEIKTKVSRNTMNIDRHVSQYVKLIYELRQEITELKEKSKAQSSGVEEGFKKALERHRKLTEEAITQVRGGQERARANIEEMGNLRALITCVENAKKIIEGWLRRYATVLGQGSTGLPELFKVEAERKKMDAEDLLKDLTDRHRNYISRLMFLQSGEGNIFEQSCKSALRMLENNGVDEYHLEYVKTEIRACKATMERDAAIRQGLKMEEDTMHYVSSLNSWIESNFTSLDEFVGTPNWGDADEAAVSGSMQTIWDFTSKLYRFKAAKCLGHTESPTRPFLSTATVLLTPSRKNRFLAQFEGSPLVKSPRRSPRKFKVGTPKRTAAQVKKKSPKKEKKKSVRWNEEAPQEFQLPPLDLTPLPSPTISHQSLPPPQQFATESEDTSFTNTDPSRPILPLPLRKSRSTSFGGAGILKNTAVPAVQQFVTEFGGYPDDSFLSTTSSTDSPLTEIAQPGQSVLRTKASRADLSDSLRGTKRRATATSPGRAKRVFSGSSIGGKENGMPSMGVRRASDSPVKSGSGGNGGRRMTLGGSAARVSNPGWGSMGPPPAALSAVRTASSGSASVSLKGSLDKKGWR